MMPTSHGLPAPRAPAFTPRKAQVPHEIPVPMAKRRQPAYLEDRVGKDALERTQTYGGEQFAAYGPPCGRVRLPIEHDVLHHEGSEMRVEANPAALGALTHTLTAAPMLGAVAAAGTAMLRKGK